MRLWIVYLMVGAVLAAFCDLRWRPPSRLERLTSGLLSIAAWPLYVPLVVLQGYGNHEPEHGSASQRIKQALFEARTAIADTPLQSLLPDSLLSQLFASLARLEKRYRDLTQLLARSDFQLEGASPLQQQSVLRLRQLLARDRASLQELVELAEGLRAQLLLAHFSGHGGDLRSATGGGYGVRELATDLAARVESLGVLFDLDSAPEPIDNPTHRRC